MGQIKFETLLIGFAAAQLWGLAPVAGAEPYLIKASDLPPYTKLGEDMRVEERFHRRDFGHLEITLMVTDPKVFTKPVTVSFVERLLPDTDVFEHYCLEDEKDAAHLPGRAGK